jgi:hypothetical protein
VNPHEPTDGNRSVNMGEQLRIGDRVRVTDANRPHGYQVGDTGRVVWIALPSGLGAVSVYCAMDRTGPDQLAPFHLDELEQLR